MNSGLFSFLKLAAPTAAKPQYQEKLDAHFSMDGNGTRWSRFKTQLRNKGFLEAVLKDERSDAKLKQYAKMVHRHKTGKGPSYDVRGSSGKSYTIKYHKDIDRYSCSCPDWTIVRSVRSGDCKHIKDLKSQVSMVKKATGALRSLVRLGRMANIKRQTESAEEQAWHAGQVNSIHRRIGLERKLRMGG